MAQLIVHGHCWTSMPILLITALHILPEEVVLTVNNIYVALWEKEITFINHLKCVRHPYVFNIGYFI